MEERPRTLEGGFRMVQIRKTKIYLYAAQLVLILAIAVILINIEGGFSLKPFYLPVNSFLFFLILMILIFNIEGCFFYALEMRFAKNESSKYYMAKRAIRRSIIIIIVAAVVVLILWLPVVSEGIETALSDSGEVDDLESFFNRDFLGLTTTDRITLTSEGEAYVYVVSEASYLSNVGNMDQLRFLRINSNDYVVNPTASFSFPEAEYGKYYFVVDYRFSTTDVVEYTLHQNLSSTFLEFVPLFGLFFIIVNVGWLTYLFPIKKKYAEKAIYR